MNYFDADQPVSQICKKQAVLGLANDLNLLNTFN